MAWNLSAWPIRNPVATVTLFLLLGVAGMVAFAGLNIAIDPDVQVPKVSACVTQLGAAPPELETQVTRKVEDAVAGIGNVKHITSTIKDGSSCTEVEFVLGTDFDRAVNETRDAVVKIRSALPAGIEEPVIRRLEASSDASTLVDDAIVEIENIIRHTAMGKSPFQAALDAADEIGLAVVATTATIVAVFLPVAFPASYRCTNPLVDVGTGTKLVNLAWAFLARSSSTAARSRQAMPRRGLRQTLRCR